MNRKGILIIVSGFSGAGKGTIMKELTSRYEQYALSVSATTRAPRPGEEDGVAYFFRTKKEFEQMIEDGALIEYARYVDNYYGTPKAYVEEQLTAGHDVILEIEIQGATVSGCRPPVCDDKGCDDFKRTSGRTRNRDTGGDCPASCTCRAGI